MFIVDIKYKGNKYKISSFNVIFLQILLFFLPILDIFHNFFVYFNIFDIMLIAFKSNYFRVRNYKIASFEDKAWQKDFYIKKGN